MLIVATRKIEKDSCDGSLVSRFTLESWVRTLNFLHPVIIAASQPRFYDSEWLSQKLSAPLSPVCHDMYVLIVAAGRSLLFVTLRGFGLGKCFLPSKRVCRNYMEADPLENRSL